MLLPTDLSCLLAVSFAAERLDTWVFRVGIAVPLVGIVGLFLWHLIAYLGRKLPKKPRAVRQSPEPPAPVPPPKLAPHLPVTATVDDPERLQQACTALEDSLAEMYLRLAESWLRKSRPQEAAAALRKALRSCPSGQWAKSAEDRLRQIGAEVENHHH